MRSILLAGLSATLLMAVPGVSSAAPAAPSTGVASIRSAHLSPDTPGVDVYLSAVTGGSVKLWVADEKYGRVSSYAAVPQGLYNVSMRLHGMPVTQPAVLSWVLNVQAGKAYTAAAVGSGDSRKATILFDDLTPPSPGKARVRLIQAASSAPQADLTAVRGPVVADDAPFATSTNYSQVAAGTWPLRAQSVGGASVLSTTKPVSVPAGSVTSILLLDRPGGGLMISTVLDAAGAARMPVGAVPAGGGGTAHDPTGTPDQSGVYLALVTLGIGALLACGMRARSRRTLR